MSIILLQLPLVRYTFAMFDTTVFHIDWLISELETLSASGLISSETAEALRAYYEKRREDERQKECAAAERRRISNAKRVPLLLSVISVLLIAGGIISLAAYNWFRIAREVKLALDSGALALLIAAAFFLLIRYGENLKTQARESFALLYALLFGGIVAYAAQTLKLPSNPAAFFSVWALSSILIAYAFAANTAFFLSLALTIAYTVTANITHANTLLFFPLFGALVPFGLKKRGGKYALIAVYAAMLGAALEKRLPGLWIVCYASSAALVAYWGSKKRDGILKYAGLAGIAVLGVILAFPYTYCAAPNELWSEVGWKYMRSGLGFGKFNMIADLSLAFVLTVSAIALPLIDSIKEAKNGGLKQPRALFALVPLGMAALYLFAAAFPSTADNGLEMGILLCLMLAAGIFGLWRIRTAQKYVWTPFVIAALILTFPCFLMGAGYLFGYFAILFSAFYLYGCTRSKGEKNGGREDKNGFAAAGIVGTAFLLFIATFNPGTVARFEKGVLGEPRKLYIAITALVAVLYAAAAIAVSVKRITAKKAFNPVIILNGFFSAVLTFLNIFGVEFCLSSLLDNFVSDPDAAEKIIVFICIAVFSLYYIYRSYKSGFVFGANAAAIYFAFVIISRFFFEDTGLLWKGIAFIACGVFIFIFNILILRREKNAENSKK